MRKRNLLLPGSPRITILSIAVACIAACSRHPALLRQVEKLGLVNSIQRELIESVEAEKSAVVATTDEESTAFAEQSKRSAEQIDRLKTRLGKLIAEDDRPQETEKLAAFSAKWDELKAVDTRLLALAVANTNLKAGRLLAKEGSAALDRFVTAVDAMTLACTDVTAIRSLSAAVGAIARIQALLFAHIPEASETEMTTIEAKIRTLAETVDGALRAAGPSIPASASDASAEATKAWADYQRIEAEVIRLSRLNTNVISFDVSTHEKRTATTACLDALTELRSAIQAGPVATR